MKTLSLRQLSLKEIIPREKLECLARLSEIAINALYCSMPNGQKNYGTKTSELGRFSIEDSCEDYIGIGWHPSRKYQVTVSSKKEAIYQGRPRHIASLDMRDHTYTINKNNIPKRLARDTESIMELLGFTEDADCE